MMIASGPVAILDAKVDRALAGAFKQSGAVGAALLRAALGTDLPHTLGHGAVSEIVNGGETDVLLVVERGDGAWFACLIEDKVTAGFAPGQPQA